MKAKLLLASVASLVFAGGSQAALIAGWDFSQYAVAGFVSLDGATVENTLVSNFSSLDTTSGTGLTSNLYGTMHIDGSFGSFNTPLDFADPFQPIELPPAGSLTSNANQPFPVPFNSPAACTIQNIESMPAANCTNFAMLSNETLGVVFEAKPGATNALQYGDNWSINFAGRLVNGTSNSIQVQFSPDGSAYATVGTANLTAVDTLYTFAAPATLSPKGFFRLNFTSDGSNNLPAIDNVGISAGLVLVPEPGTAMLLLAGLVGLAKSGSRRA